MGYQKISTTDEDLDGEEDEDGDRSSLEMSRFGAPLGNGSAEGSSIAEGGQEDEELKELHFD